LNYPLVYPLAARNVKQQADRGAVVEFRVEFRRGGLDPRKLIF
jgi:hypothetical protein